MKQGYDSSKLKMFAKDILAKTSDKVLSQNEKQKQNKKTIMVTMVTETVIQNTSKKISSTY